MMKILSIGNSFSQDAHRYLHGIAKAEGKDFRCINLYIGGCSLSMHYRNFLGALANYSLECNGVTTGFHTSIQDALLADKWDVITLQNVSNESPFFESFDPYLSFLGEKVRLYQPEAKLYLQQTWGYADDYPRLAALGFSSMEEMFFRVRESYKKAKALIHADGIIPSGEAMRYLYAVAGLKNAHRDGFHANLGFGRYAIGCTWYQMLTGERVSGAYNAFDIAVTAEEKERAELAANVACISV